MLDAAIIGAPRSGTSALFEWLESHPNIQGSTPKETYFFMDAEHPLAIRQENEGEPTLHTASLSAFDRFFDNSTEAVRLEATTHHYYQQTARDVFSQFDPKPHVFFALRQPAHRIRSSFLFTKHNRGYIDPGLTFNQYVNILLDGSTPLLDQYYYSDSSLYIASRELELSKYVIWLKHWVECLGSDRVHPFLFEHFADDSRHVVVQICHILGLETSCVKWPIPSKNETTLVRSPRLQPLAHEIGSQVPNGWVKRTMKSLYEWLQNRDTSSTTASNTDRGVRKLEEYFVPWNERLSQYSGLSLSEWNPS